VTRWIEVGDRLYARRHVALDQTLGLIVGDERCLVVDSGTDEVHGADWLAAVREVTPLPWTLLITHAHWDHFFGTAPFTPCEIWSHPVCRQEIAENAEDHRARGLRNYPDGTEQREWMAAARVVLPTEPVDPSSTVDLGGRVITLTHPGRGHTGGDVVVHVPDAATVFAGDLVEQGAPPAIGPDAYPLDWPSTLDTVLTLGPETVVPGHGELVGPVFVREQRDELAVVAGLYRAVSAGELTVEEAILRSPYPEDYTRPTLVRAAGSTSAR
jgi:glyoxylase-like metal-dependent hydrolase (beta-lactamase superfamily II)